MSLEKLKREVIAQAEREATASLEQARAEEKQVEGEAREKAKHAVHEAEELARAEARELAAELRATALLQAKRMESEAREHAVQSVLEEVRDEMRRLASTKRQRYEKVFDALARQAVKALGEKDFVLKANARDKALASKYGNVASEAIETDGGLIAASSNGGVSINNTFEALVEENEEELKQDAFEELFGAEKKREKNKIEKKTERKSEKTGNAGKKKSGRKKGRKEKK